MAEKKIIDKINIFLQKIKEAGIAVEKAYLFGSYTKGTENPDSDIDVMIVSSVFDKDGDNAAGIVWSLTKTVDIRIEPYIIGLNRFNSDNVSPLLQIVKKEGILIE